MIRQLIMGAAMVACAVHAQDSTPPQTAALQKQEIAKGEPARWSQADTTKAERERTLRKEIGAALAEARQACQKGAAADRSTCLQDAKSTYQHDLANIPQLLTQSQ